MSSSSLGEIIDRDNELLWGVGLREEAVRFDKHCLHAVRQTLARRIKDPRPALGGLPAQRFDRPSAVFL